MITLSSARILVISPTDDDRVYMQAFFDHVETLATPDFQVNKFVPSDKYDFIIFDCRAMPVYKVEDFVDLPTFTQSYFFLLDRYLTDTNKYILFFGKFYHKLNSERCAAANSKFTLFARIREMIEFLNHYRTE